MGLPMWMPPPEPASPNFHVNTLGISEVFCPPVESSVESGSGAEAGSSTTVDNVHLDVVLVHDPDENPNSAWTSAQSIFWPAVQLPGDLQPFNARILTYGYRANFSDFENTDLIKSHARTFLAALNANRQLESCTLRPIVFVCHSLGCYLVMGAIIRSATRLSMTDEHLRLIYISTYTILLLGAPRYFLGDSALALATSSIESDFGPYMDLLFPANALSTLLCDTPTIENWVGNDIELYKEMVTAIKVCCTQPPGIIDERWQAEVQRRDTRMIITPGAVYQLDDDDLAI